MVIQSSSIMGLQALGSFLMQSQVHLDTSLSEAHQSTSLALSSVLDGLGYEEVSSQLSKIDEPGTARLGARGVISLLEDRKQGVATAIALATYPEPELGDAEFLSQAQLSTDLEQGIQSWFISAVEGATSVFNPASAAELSQSLSCLQRLGILELILPEPVSVEAKSEIERPYQAAVDDSLPAGFRVEWVDILPSALKSKVLMGRFKRVESEELTQLYEKCIELWAVGDRNKVLYCMGFMDWLAPRLPQVGLIRQLVGNNPSVTLSKHYFSLFKRINTEMQVQPVYVEDLQVEVEAALRDQDFFRIRSLCKGLVMKGSPEEMFFLEGIMHPYIRIMILKCYLQYSNASSQYPNLKGNLLHREMRMGLIAANTRSPFEFAAIRELADTMEAFGAPQYKAQLLINMSRYLSNSKLGGVDLRQQVIGEDLKEIEVLLGRGIPEGVPDTVKPSILKRDMRGVSIQVLNRVAEGMRGCQSIEELQKYHAIFVLAENTVDDPFVRTKAYQFKELALAKGLEIKFSGRSIADDQGLAQQYARDPLGTTLMIKLQILNEPNHTRQTILKFALYQIRQQASS